VRDDCKLECAVAFRCERRQLGYCEAFGGSLAGGPEGKQLGWRYTLAFGGYVGRSYGGEVYDGRLARGYHDSYGGIFGPGYVSARSGLNGPDECGEAVGGTVAGGCEGKKLRRGYTLTFGGEFERQSGYGGVLGGMLAGAQGNENKSRYPLVRSSIGPIRPHDAKSI
jgi:hypothetical protein